MEYQSKGDQIFLSVLLVVAVICIYGIGVNYLHWGESENDRQAREFCNRIESDSFNRSKCMAEMREPSMEEVDDYCLKNTNSTEDLISCRTNINVRYGR
ncbi:hypothetical protein C4565_01415 [Candidatus Parcubacteria bacterium]|nr:MAG: hypothetical protein C4565_01415 [Candidatus Parcubacteria bacterium]